MKRFISIAVLVVLTGLFLSCVTYDKKSRPLVNLPNANVVGTVQTIFETGPTTAKGLDQQAYIRLLEEAKKQYSGNIDVYDVIWTQVRVIKYGKLFEMAANGKVILLGGESAANVGIGVEGALARAAQETLKNVPARSKIAIVYITAQDRSTTEYIVGELEFIWVNAGYTIIDRNQLDRIRQEQKFQMSGEVDDNTAVSIGKIIGANIIVTGRVDGEGNLRRLRLRALNTETAQVVGVASERL